MALIATLIAIADSDAEVNGLAAGQVHARIDCADYPGQSYALYLPVSYTPDRAWPVVYCFDPAARGTAPVERMREAAERLGYIVVASNNSRNGSWLRSAAAAEAMLQDSQRRLHLDRRRLYAAGFSGGARVATRVAELGGFAGVIACGAGFSQGQVPDEVAFAFFGTAGLDDFNYQEMRRTDALLAGRQAAHRLVIFDGGHDWMPDRVAADALQWLNVQAIRTGTLERNDAWLHTVFAARMHAAEMLPDKAAAWLEYVGLAADFQGLVDTQQAAERATTLERSREIRRYLAAEKKAAAAEERWLADLDAAIACMREPSLPLRDLADVESIWRRSPAGLPGDATGGLRGAVEEESSRTDTTLARNPFPSLPPANPTEPLRELVRELNRRARNEPAARRVLASGFALAFDGGRESMDGRDYAEAARRFEAATILKPEDPRAHYRLACAYAGIGRRDQAQDSLNMAIASGFADQAAIEALSQALAKKDATVTELEPFVVRDLPALESSFGLALVVTADPESRQILRVTIKEVARNSEAEARGIVPGAIIVSADGRSVQTLTARFTRDSDFHRLFMERRDGDSIRLEIVTKPGFAPRTFTLTQGHDATSADRPWLANSPY